MNPIPLQKIKITVADSGMRLERWLKHKLPQESYGSLQKLIRTGQIRIDGKRVKANAILQEGQEVRLPPRPSTDRQVIIKPAIDPQWIQEIQQAILYEDSHLIILNKPAGLAVQGGTGTKISLDELVRALPFSWAQDLRLTHRLDKDTSGVLILAKTASDARWITEQFKQGKIQKTYWALVVGKPKKTTGIVDLPLSKLPTSSGEKINIDPTHGVKAVTRYHLKAHSQGISWIEFYPQTGRTHQIRVHSASLDCPVLGDGKYGGKKAHPFQQRTRLHLHAYSLCVTFPTGEEKTFIAPLPADMEKTFERLAISFDKFQM